MTGTVAASGATNAPAGDTVTREMRYVLTDIGANANKFWHVREFGDGAFETHWGRVGESGQIKRFAAALSSGGTAVDAKCREKERKGYRLQRTLGGTASLSDARENAARLAQVATEQITMDTPETVELVRYLASVNVHQILSATALRYDVASGLFSTPLGIVTEDGIREARRLLGEIGGFVARSDWGDKRLIGSVNEFLMLVPQNVGRARPEAQTLFPTLDAIQQQNGVLDSLQASLDSVLADAEAKRKSDEQAKAKSDVPAAPPLFEARLKLVGDSAEIERIRRKYRGTQQAIHASHCLEVTRVFALEIGSMARAFWKDGGVTVGNVQELWHGTRAGNLLSILRAGFTIPPANAPHVTGRMFGNGVYFSDQSTKSLNYACGMAPRQTGGPAVASHNGKTYMLLCDVAMGKSHTPDRPGAQVGAPAYDSTFAKAGVSGVLNNEMIVYRTAQINPTRLVEFSA